MTAFHFTFPEGFESLPTEQAADPGLSADALGRLALCGTAEDALLQSIAMILSTTPGERVLRPEYGSRLHELVYMPNDPATAGLAIQYIREAIGRWEPRVVLEMVDAAPDPNDASRLVIWARYRARGEAAVREFQLDLDLGGS